MMRIAAVVGLSLALAGCATELRVPRFVPPPPHEFAASVPFDEAWEASLRALRRLDFTPVEGDRAQGTITSTFALDGNSERVRNDGVGRLAIERDLYAAGRGRLVVHVVPVGANDTQVHVAAEIQARVTRRGEVRYATAPGTSALPLLTASTPARAAGEGSEWETLTSDGVLEDEFLAAFVVELLKPRVNE